MTPDAAFLTYVARLADEAPGVLTHALATGGQYADLFYEHTVHHGVTWYQDARRGAVKRPVQVQAPQVFDGVGIRVLGAKRMGFAATDERAPQSLDGAASEAAAELGRTGAAREALPITTHALLLDLPPDAPDAIAASEKAALVQAAAEAAFSFEEVRTVRVAYHDRVRRAAVATSEGVLRASASMLMGLRVEVTLASGGGSVTAHAVGGTTGGFGHFFAHPPEHLARRAVERARHLLGAKPLPAGTMPVVLAAGWCGVWLHEAVGHHLEADTVAAGGSPFAGSRGQRIAAETITLIDDTTHEGGRGTYPFDDEGTPACRTTLIENGVLRSFLTDRRTAKPPALPRTGNARRQDYRHAPLPRMTNLLLLPGPTDPADLIADVADGLYVQDVGHGVVQPGGGFAFEVLEGYRIEQGRLGAPVAGARLVGTGPEVLGGVVGVGRDFEVDAARGLCKKAGQVVPVSVGMPTVLVGAMEVVG